MEQGAIEVDTIADLMKIVEETKFIGIENCEALPAITIRDSWE